MKYYILLGLFLIVGCKVSDTIVEEKVAIPTIQEGKKSIYDYSVKDINGEDFSFSKLKGRKIMIVNTASKCGLTPQYEILQNIYEKYKKTGFMIIGFPANNFMSQEPGSNEDIKKFCKGKFGITFPMMAKVSVKGKEKDPIYKFLTEKEFNGVMDSKVTWNFQKYLIDENGFLVKSVSPKVKPMDEEIIGWIESE